MNSDLTFITNEIPIRHAGGALSGNGACAKRSRSV